MKSKTIDSLVVILSFGNSEFVASHNSSHHDENMTPTGPKSIQKKIHHAILWAIYGFRPTIAETINSQTMVSLQSYTCMT